jgi:hypothetical protein
MNVNPKDRTRVRSTKGEKPPESPPKPYAAIPVSALDSDAYINLSDAAVRLLVELTRRHGGWNNGALFVSFKTLATRGMKSRAKVSRAFDELVMAGFIVMTRAGSREENAAARYALLWMPATRTNKDGSRKEMPLMPSPYQISRFLMTQPVTKETRLKGRAKLNQAAKIEREVYGKDDAQQDRTGVFTSVPPGGKGSGQKTAEMVPPGGKGVTALRNRHYRPAVQPCTAQRYGFNKSWTTRRFKFKQPKSCHVESR